MYGCSFGLKSPSEGEVIGFLTEHLWLCPKVANPLDTLVFGLYVMLLV